MSPSDGGRRGEGVLIARGGPGTEIRIVDTDYQVVGRGAEELSLTLPEGIYIVDWTSGGETTEQIVRLHSIEQPLIVALDLPEEPEADVVASEASGARERMAEMLSSQVPTHERTYDSSVVVVIRTDGEEAKSEVAAHMRLLNGRDRAMRSNEKDVAELQAQEEFALRSYRVRPGHYHLSFRAATGEMLDQTIPAIAGRRTVVVARAETEEVLVAEDGAFHRSLQHGVDPTQTVVFTVPAGSPTSALSEGARLAGVLLHDLASGSGSLGESFIKTLDGDDADPLLRLYATAVILTRLEQDASPTPGESWPSDPAAREESRQYWLRRAAQWLESLQLKGMPTDVTTAAWRLWRFGIEVAGRSTIKRPPMLEASWAWAVARSVTHKAAVPMTAALRAASRSAGGTSPWLCWRAAAAKADLMPAPKTAPDDIHVLLDALSEKVKGLVADAVEEASVASDPLAGLSVDARATALKSLEALQETAAPAAGKDALEAAVRLAASFAHPAPQLTRRLIRALDEIERMGSERTPEGTEPDDAAPALHRRIETPDDPNKGRFGRRAERGGFRLKAEFEETISKDWVRIALIVETDLTVPDGLAVQFYLHDSFRPARIDSRLKGRRAREKVTSWGGFTVGVWIPSHRVELELDLAKLPTAPRIVKTR